MDAVKQLQGLMAEVGDSVHTTTVAPVIPQEQFYGTVAKRKPPLKKKKREKKPDMAHGDARRWQHLAVGLFLTSQEGL